MTQETLKELSKIELHCHLTVLLADHLLKKGLEEL